MSNSRLRARAGLACAIALVCASAVACDSVLDIQDPMMRPADGGEPSTSGGTASAAAGSATTQEGGGAGEGGVGGGAGGSDPIVAGAGAGGEGGVVTPPDCVTDSVRCTDNTPEVCDEIGQWVPNVAEAEGACAVQCSEGRCVECLPEQKRCTVCEDGDANCNTNQPQSCVDGAWANTGAPCKQFCAAGACQTTLSCPEFYTARTTCRGNESCCASLHVPGGTFELQTDDGVVPAEVSPFNLDKYEVTVGRMRQFVYSYDPGNLKAGQGKAPHIDDDAGWDPALQLPATKEALIAALENCSMKSGSTWSDSDVIDHNALPLNCVPFAVAYAFCVWDGGRLPTEAEWNFAAAGGSSQRPYPWSTAPDDLTISSTHAVYSPATEPANVGSRSEGDGRWGHADMAGNLLEWVLDYYGEYGSECINCLNTSPGERAQRGGAYDMFEDALLSSFRTSLASEEARPNSGFRCARDLR